MVNSNPSIVIKIIKSPLSLKKGVTKHFFQSTGILFVAITILIINIISSVSCFELDLTYLNRISEQPEDDVESSSLINCFKLSIQTGMAT